jgi:hypothetical protein
MAMRIDFINDGSHDFPLVRLFSGEKNEIGLLRSFLLKLSGSELNEIAISDLPFCATKLKLLFRLGTADRGMQASKDKREFCLELEKESWLEMAEKLDPFLEDPAGFAWLYESGPIVVLFTTDGYW